MKKLTDFVTFKHGATLTNRLVQAPMLTNSGLNEAVTQDTLNYYAARSQSAGMVIVEYTSVSPNGGPSRSWAKDREQLALYDDDFKPGLTKVAKALKKDGNKAILQLVHSGREAQFRGVLGGNVEVPTDMDFPWIDYPLHELTEDEVWQIVKDFGQATKRAIECGFDGVEIHGANHYLLQEFFSKYSNQRTDFWGGSLGKRMNFAKEVSREVFKVVNELAPKNFIVGYRISPEEIHGDNVGYTWHESTQLVQALTESFDFDYIHLSELDYRETASDTDKMMADLFRPVIKNNALEIVAGSVRSEADMLDLLNHVDLVAIGRATLIDPQIGQKINQGRGADIIHSFSPQQAKAACLTQGLIDLLTNLPKDMKLPGTKSLESLKTVDLGSVVVHK
ncbi:MULTISPECIES: NADH-dependent oxidoreductase [Levilactobacillus]|uniref:oxidoreductase n=1 Tax=Levilactobacillus TaxID=2767886 RepID=UPI001950DFC9|nr:NADH-dependent oxidoreductase [Levilactobacillus sp. 244-2]